MRSKIPEGCAGVVDEFGRHWTVEEYNKRFCNGGSPEDRIKKTLDIAYHYALVDGAHHKTWVIDQMIQALTGDGYDEWIRVWTEDGIYDWDTGIAP